MTDRCRRRFLPWIALGLLLGLTLFLLWALRGTLPMLAIVFFLAYLFHPLALRLERLRVRRAVSAAGLVALVFSLLAAASLLLIPPLVEEGQSLIAQG